MAQKKVNAVSARRYEFLEREAVKAAKKLFSPALPVAAVPASFYAAPMLRAFDVDCDGQKKTDRIGAAVVQFQKGFQAFVIFRESRRVRFDFVRHADNPNEQLHIRGFGVSLRAAGAACIQKNPDAPGVVMIAPFFGVEGEGGDAAPVEPESDAPPVEPTPAKPRRGRKPASAAAPSADTAPRHNPDPIGPPDFGEDDHNDGAA